MTTVENQTTEPQTQGKAQELNWKEKAAKKWYLTKLADTGLQIAKDARRQAVVERLIKKTQDGTLGESTTEPMEGVLEEDMGVSIGNETYETHNHYHAAPEPTKPAPPPQPQQVQPSQPESGSSLPKTLAALGLAAAGLSTALTVPMVAWNLSRKDKTPETSQQEFVDTDTDTIMGLRVYRPNVPPPPE